MVLDVVCDEMNGSVDIKIVYGVIFFTLAFVLCDLFCVFNLILVNLHFLMKNLRLYGSTVELLREI